MLLRPLIITPRYRHDNILHRSNVEVPGQSANILTNTRGTIPGEPPVLSIFAEASMTRASSRTTALAAASLLILPSLAFSAIVTMFVASIILAFHVMKMYILWFLRVSGIRSRPQEKIHELRNGFGICVARLIGARHDRALYDEEMSDPSTAMTIDDDIPPPSYIESEWIEQGRIISSKKGREPHGLSVASTH
ncbi:hypothetical protein V1523DRAFT_430481 [Lipomyces doorenjongii]